MPIYLYHCRRCLREFEALRKMGQGPPVCCGVRARKLPAASSFKLKGAGFHCNDYKGKK